MKLEWTEKDENIERRLGNKESQSGRIQTKKEKEKARKKEKKESKRNIARNQVWSLAEQSRKFVMLKK